MEDVSFESGATEWPSRVREDRHLSFSNKRADDVSVCEWGHSWRATPRTRCSLLRYYTIREEDHLLRDELKMPVARTSRQLHRRAACNAESETAPLGEVGCCWHTVGIVYCNFVLQSMNKESLYSRVYRHLHVHIHLFNKNVAVPYIY